MQIDFNQLNSATGFIIALCVIGASAVLLLSNVQKQALKNYQELARSRQEQLTDLQKRFDELEAKVTGQEAMIKKLEAENQAMLGYTALGKVIEKMGAHFDGRLDVIDTKLNTMVPHN